MGKDEIGLRIGVWIGLRIGDGSGLRIGDRSGLRIVDRSGLRIGDGSGLRIGSRWVALGAAHASAATTVDREGCAKRAVEDEQATR